MTTIGEHDQKMLDDFFSSIELLLPGYKHSHFSFFAIEQNGAFILVQGRLYLLGLPFQGATGAFETPSVKVGSFSLGDLKTTPKEMLDLILTGKLSTPQGDLQFPPNQGTPYSVFFNPLHTGGIQSQTRQMQLVINGGQRPHSNFAGMDWEVKAAARPFDSLQELCTEYSVGAFGMQQVSVEVIAHNLAAIDGKSVVNGKKASLTLLLAQGLESSKSAIGYRLFDKGKVAKREQIAGSTLTWDSSDGLQRGKIEIDVPSGAVLHCVANYAGQAHHHFWVVDPLTVANPRRAVHQAFDSNMEILQELLKLQGKGREARDFESAIAWILWMLGFSVAHLGGTAKTSDASDLIATTPKGHFLVIECTTGILKAENKLANLIDRTEKVRKSLLNSGNNHLKVLAVIVTNKSREEVRAEAEQAERDGVFVGTRDGFAEMINLTQVQPDPDVLFERAEQKLAQAQAPNQLS